MKTHWSISRRVSRATAEIILELLKKAYGNQKGTEIAADEGIFIDEIVDHAPLPTVSGTKRPLRAVDVASNNALQKSKRVGRLWLIVPDAQRPPRTQRLVLKVTPGMGFGSGSHPTTQMCLRLMERESSAKSLLDIGTGSGILAIAASRLGIPRIVALDHDFYALRNARANARLNDSCIEWKRADLMKWRTGSRFEVITANLLSQLLISQASKIVSWLKPKGRLILSGLFRNECKEVESIFRQHGFRTLEILFSSKWAAIRMQKRE